MATLAAGVALRTTQDLYRGQALSADFTGHAYREHLKLSDVPLLSSYQAGQRLNILSSQYHFSMFEYWLSDVAGHRRNMQTAVELLETLDGVLAGLAAQWPAEDGLILVTSDHGNLEDLSTRRHTGNPVPAILIGNQHLRLAFSHGLTDLAGISPAIWRFFNL